MRITWLEALCILTIAVATLQLQLHGRDKGTSFLTLPMLAGSKATVIATNAPPPDPALHLVKSARNEK